MVTPVVPPPEDTAGRHLVGGIPLAVLVREFHCPMVKFAQTMVDSPILAEEAVQEAWVQVMQSSCSFQGRSSVSTWLFGVVRNTALQYRRRESRIRDHELLASADAEATDPLAGRMHPAGHPDAGHWSAPPSRRFLSDRDLTMTQDIVGHVRAALDALPQRQRQLVILRDVVGMSAEDAAQILDLSADAQRALLYRARGNLRNALEKRYQQ